MTEDHDRAAFIERLQWLLKNTPRERPGWSRRGLSEAAGSHVRALAASRRELRGVVKVRLSDERGRAALFVDEDDIENTG